MVKSLGAYLSENFLFLSQGISGAWRRWSTGALENEDRNTGATGQVDSFVGQVS